ncbi:MAG: hypothetical protein U9O55_01475 [Patescibacteria group bacterium]|nr:hypothetical protein [Patescibacteria group bacterium]
MENKKCENKLKIQQKEIQKYLKSNSNNFWLNTAGFKELFLDLTKKK